MNIDLEIILTKNVQLVKLKCQLNFQHLHFAGIFPIQIYKNHYIYYFFLLLRWLNMIFPITSHDTLIQNRMNNDGHKEITIIVSFYLNPNFFFSFSFFLATSNCLSRQELFLNLIGLFPTYLPGKKKQKYIW